MTHQVNFTCCDPCFLMNKTYLMNLVEHFSSSDCVSACLWKVGPQCVCVFCLQALKPQSTWGAKETIL